jgi:hypothetical protein
MPSQHLDCGGATQWPEIAITTVLGLRKDLLNTTGKIYWKNGTNKTSHYSQLSHWTLTALDILIHGIF